MTSEAHVTLVEPLPGVGLDRLRQTLFELSAELTNARATPGKSGDGYKAYIRWANNAAQSLATQISATDVDRLVLGRRYWHLQSMPEQGEAGRLGNLLAAEFHDRSLLLDTTVSALDADIKRWARAGVVVVADTSFYLTHPDKIEDTDLTPLLGIREEAVRLVVPIVVVDELDQLKRSGDKTVRWRAAYTLAVLDRLLPHPTQPAQLRAEDFSAIDQQTGGIPRGEVTVELLLDPPGHRRLPIADDEIVDRALAAQTRSGRTVTMLTYDTGQALRARTAGLMVKKLTIDDAAR